MNRSLSWRRAQVLAYGVEARLKDPVADHVGHGLLVPGTGGEPRLPMPERAVAVGNRQEPDVGDIVEQGDRGIEQAIAEALLEVREREQLLAQLRSVGKLNPAHATDAIRALAALDGAGSQGGVPAIEAVEVAQNRPDLIG